MILWLKALHIIAVISWMAGLLYLPRLFVYHAGEPPGSATSKTFVVMQARLLRFIMRPAAAVVWISGPFLAWQMGVLADRWLWLKLVLVVALSFAHDRMERWHRDFEQHRNRKTARFFRFANEIPTLLMIAIVLLVVLKPFH